MMVKKMKMVHRQGITWNGKNSANVTAASGIYFVVVRSGSWEARGKIAIVKQGEEWQ